jgi:Xaa-Pro aminopeptidase
MRPEERRRQVQRRLDRVRAICEARGGGVAVLASRANVAWLTAGGQHHVVLSSATGVGRLAVTPDSATLVAPSIEVDRLEHEEIGGLGINTVAVPWWQDNVVGAAIESLADGRPVLDDAALEGDLRGERSILENADIERLAVLGRAAEQAVTDAIAAIERGATEDELAASLLGRLVGIRAPVVLVAADERIERFRHPLPGGQRIGGRVMLVLVGEAWGLHVALTRIRELEEPPTYLADRMRDVLEVERAMIDATTPGATLGDVVRAAQAAYAKAGYPDEWRDHHQGGTIAYNGREVVATPGDATVIEPGMAFAWNPSIAGAKAEDTFVLMASGARRFVTSGRRS